MRIAANAAVSIDYVLTNAEGEVIDSNDGQPPLTYLHGHGNIVVGLERALEGRRVGDALSVEVQPAEGYGERHEDLVVEMAREDLPEGLEPEVGMMLAAKGPKGDEMPVWITHVGDEQVVLDGNHPLAGEVLKFEVTVREVRAATDEELAHGHVHGEGGAHH